MASFGSLHKGSNRINDTDLNVWYGSILNSIRIDCTDRHMFYTDLQPDDLQPLFHRKRPESDSSVPDATARAEKFAQRYTEILEDLKKDPESHGGPPDCILLYRLREQVLRKLGFQDIFKKVKDEENAKAISPFENVVDLNDAIEDEVKRVENLVRGIFAGNIFDLGSAQLAEIFSKDGMSFLASCQNLVPRHWVIDDMDAFKLKWTKKSWKKGPLFHRWK
ncbi:damage-control phosphatase At2g17340-like [Malus domestica]|uniref:damage-control phosphatase At2g17340-like n=1 Tax=Malus domestica TaxID=3750 RepID=UPI0039747D2B